MLWYKRLRQRLLDDPRFARILYGSFSGLMWRGLALLVSAVTLPLTLRLLGELRYGVWVTVSTSVMMLSVLDLGIANTLTNFISEAHAANDREKAQHSYATAFWVTLAVAVVLAPAVWGAWRVVNWASLFHLADPVEAHQAGLCVALAGGFFLAALPLSLANRVLLGFQQVHIANYFAMVNSVLGLLAILVASALHGSLLTLMLVYSVAMLMGTLSLNVWLNFWQRPWIKPLPGRVNPSMIRKLFGQGSLFFVLQLTGLVVFNSDNLVLAHFLGASAVTPYSVAWRVTQYVSLLQGFLIASLWPAFTEAYHKGQIEWIRSFYHSIKRKTLLAVSTAAMLMGLFGRTMIRAWAGPGAVPSVTLMWLMAAYAIVTAMTTHQAVLLTATGRLRLEAGVAVLAAAANLLLSIMLVQRIGPEGVILSTIISFLVFMIVPQEWEVRRILKGHYLAPESHGVPLEEATGTT